MNNNYISSISLNIIDSVKVENPLPNGRYGIWILLIRNIDSKSVDLESIDSLCLESFDQYKGYLYQESNLSDSQPEVIEVIEACLVVGKTNIRKITRC